MPRSDADKAGYVEGVTGTASSGDVFIGAHHCIDISQAAQDLSETPINEIQVNDVQRA